MDSQLFFYINLALGLGMLLWFLSARKNSGHTPTKLNLRAPESKGSDVKGQTSSEKNLVGAQEGTTRQVMDNLLNNQKTTNPSEFKKPEWKPRKSTNMGEDTAIRNAKPLNVRFIFNGHDWDAYEVLGLPAGASLPLVTERYQQLIQQADQGQLDFYEAAYSAILKKL